MVWPLKILLITCLLYVLYQDVRERQVYWFLFPVVSILCGLLFVSEGRSELFPINMLMNLLFVGTVLLVLFVYVKFKMGKNILDNIGIGDIVLFFGLCASFSLVPFIVIFVSALIFSLFLHISIKKIDPNHGPTVPLAGYMCLFFAMAYVFLWCGAIDNLYTI